MPEFVGSPLPKWRAIPLDHRLKSLLRPGAGGRNRRGRRWRRRGRDEAKAPYWLKSLLRPGLEEVEEQKGEE